ncbi:DUF3526 domain-containing protein [Hyphococcus lacteus]|uniref:DUF3526 domain-containing protein n=1 Tax=Hyphococcus lacteus TaxID=3143536 RepID=A0ABV3Z646_9PROT
MINSTTFILERRIFIFALPGILIFSCLTLLGAYAAISGKSYVERELVGQQAFLTEANQAVDEWREELVEIEASGVSQSPYSARPMNLRLPAVLNPAPLADFATGAGGLFPTTTKLTGWANPADLFIEYEFANPTILGSGRFDLTFLVVVLMPLVMIAASFDIFSADRERGRSRITAMQAGHIHSSIWKRLVLRNTVLWLVFSLIALFAALITPFAQISSARILSFGVWIGVSWVYGLFWFSVISLAVSVLKRSEAVAAALFSIWAVFVFAVPAIGGAVAEAAYPPPSRLVFLSEMREGEVEGVRDAENLTNALLAEHPEMVPSVEDVPGYFRGAFLSNREANERTTPVLEAFTETRHKRKNLVGRMQFLSPALIANNALVTVAGGDVNRNMEYQAQARESLSNLYTRISPAVVAKQRISIEEFDSIPEFSFSDRTSMDVLGDYLAVFGFMIIVSIFLIVIAMRRLRSPLDKLL